MCELRLRLVSGAVDSGSGSLSSPSRSAHISKLARHQLPSFGQFRLHLTLLRGWRL